MISAEIHNIFFNLQIFVFMSQIEKNYGERMPNGTHYTFHQSTLKRTKNDTVLCGKSLLAPLIAGYEAAFLAEEEKFRLSQKSKFTDTLNELDEKRDNAYRGFKQIVGGYAKVPDAAMQTASKALNQLITDYKIDVDIQRDQESGLLSNFISDLEGKCAAHVQTLGIGLVAQVLKEANDQYIEIRDSRTEERMQKEKKALETARTATDEAYNKFIAMVNALAMVEGEAEYANFINFMNTLINEYKTEALNQKPSTPDPIQPEGEGGGTTEPTDPDTPNPETPDPETPEPETPDTPGGEEDDEDDEGGLAG